jgi:hypothetical protein
MIPKMYRRTLCTALFLVFFSVLHAQGNLQFNQVKLVSTVETVPAGKIWKVESILYSTAIVGNGNATIAFSIGTDASILVNGVNTVTRSTRGVNTSQGGAYYTVWDIALPIWLPAGSTLSSSTGVSSISVVEFNLIP